MKSQLFVSISVALVASVLVTGIASTIYAQSNMTGGYMTGGPQLTAVVATVMTMEAETVMKAEGTAIMMDRVRRAKKITRETLF